MAEHIYLEDYAPETGLVLKQHIPPRPRFPVIDMHAHMGPMLLGEGYEAAYNTHQQKQLLQASGVEKLVSLELVWGDAFLKLKEKLSAGDGFFDVFPSVDVSRFEEPGFERMVYQTLKEYANDGVHGLKLWKNITLNLRDADGHPLRLNDKKLRPVFQYAGEFGLPIVIHVGDPPQFFMENSPKNEYYLCLTKHPEWSFHVSGLPTFQEHIEMQEAMIAENPGTTFVVAHVGSYSENLDQVSKWLDAYPNMYIDISARIDQLGRQPYTSLAFLKRFEDRILFGTDYEPTIAPSDFYSIHYRFLETKDEYFDHPFAGFLGIWKIYGIDLDDTALEKIYKKNAQRVLGL